jgi:CRISPR-associated protein Cas5t
MVKFMKYCLVEIRTQTATFRNPEFQNFHKSFRLPPPTTLVGLAGAALGLSPKASQEFFSQTEFEMGVYGKSQGLTKDLWKYNDFKSGSIIHKEILFENRFICVYGTTEDKLINKLKESFQNPRYALTLGNSDSLANIILPVKILSDTSDKNIIKYCLLEGDILQEVIDNTSNGIQYSIYTTSDPITYELPTKFNYSSEYGKRSVEERKKFSFVGKEMQLNVTKKAVIHDDVFIPLFVY